MGLMQPFAHLAHMFEQTVQRQVNIVCMRDHSLINVQPFVEDEAHNDEDESLRGSNVCPMQGLNN